MASMLKLSSDFSMPVLGLGTAKAAPGTVAKAVEMAIKMGYRHIDCAYVYGNEKDVGLGLKSAIDQGVVTREEMFITSKLWCTCYRKDLVKPCLQQSLKNLGLDYIDLYLLHFPFSMKQEDPTEGEGEEGVLRVSLYPQEEDGKAIPSDIGYLEPWKILEECVRSGVIRSIGLSNFNSVQIQDVIDNAEIKPAVLQIECHPYLTQKPLINFCHEHDIVVTAYCPLGGPAGNDGPFNAPIARIHDDPQMIELGKKYGKTPAQIAIRFNVQRNLVVIPRSCNEGRLQQNLDVFDFVLSDEDMKTVFSMNRDLRTVPALPCKDFPSYPFNIQF